ncbi:MAG TPA: serine/threonine-protein kinase, partial [Polyangiaceae bacterium]|nr:serine/threonine-protein kinase [Polyangiaceae bacterium]
MDPFQPELASVGEFQPGSVLVGKYRVVRVIGQGGMGVVVAAIHIELDTPVAIKFLLPEARNEPEVVARFAREARAAAQIKSEYVARTFDVGRLDNGSPFIVMEYLDGIDLAKRIADMGPLPIFDAVSIALQVCDALREAHALGIVHRDLKPANLFLAQRRDGSEVVKLLDFGISKLTLPGTGTAGSSMTRTSSMMGSPFYMSPEQLISPKDVDPRSDIWALGATLYESLAGSPPFAGNSMA